MQSQHVFQERIIYLSAEESSDGVVSITFSPPIVIENLMVFPLEYSFVPMSVGGIIPPNTRKSFYFDQVTLFPYHCRKTFIINSNLCMLGIS